MGCCFSGEDDTDGPRQASERDPLLGGSSTPIANGPRSVNDDSHNHNSGPISRTDEQSLLSRILHQTAHNVIDVSSTEPHSIERTEYMERSRQYMSKLSAVSGSAHQNTSDLPNGVKVPQSVLASEPIPQGDIMFVIQAAKGANASLSGFHVEQKDELVVQFESS